jgi:colicin import membrane protein
MLALALHAAAVWSLLVGWNPERERVNFVKPKMVKAQLIVLEAKAKPAARPVVKQPAQPAPEPVTKPQAKPKPKPDVDPARLAAKKAQEEAAAKAAERNRAEQERQARLAALSKLAESSMEQAIAEESADLQAGTEDMVAQSYQAGIYELVRQNWSRPPSARNGMSAKLQVELIPTGEVVAVTIIESSGNSAFDRSAEQAVKRARRFEVPAENSIFERYFRRFYFLFQPDDLLR